MSAFGIISPYFFQDGNHLTVMCYSETLEYLLEPGMENFGGFNRKRDFSKMERQLTLPMEVAHRMFPEKVILKNGNARWSPRSPDLTPVHFFLCGYLKIKVCDPLPANLNQLKQRIRSDIQAIPEQLCRRLFTHFRGCLEETVRRKGWLLDDLIFHE